jgi:hypothetical protein
LPGVCASIILLVETMASGSSMPVAQIISMTCHASSTVDPSRATGIDSFAHLAINNGHAGFDWIGAVHLTVTIWIQSGGVDANNSGCLIHVWFLDMFRICIRLLFYSFNKIY